MKRIRFRRKTAKLLQVASFVAAVTALSSGLSLGWAQQAAPEVKAAPVDPAIAARDAAAAVRARKQRDAAIKRRQDTRKYIQTVVEGQSQPGVTAVAPVLPGGAK